MSSDERKGRRAMVDGAELARRLAEAYAAKAAAEELATAAGDEWAELVVEAVDLFGLSQVEVAELAGVNRAAVLRALRRGSR